MVKEIVCLDKSHVSSFLGESLLRTKVGIVSMAVNAPWLFCSLTGGGQFEVVKISMCLEW